ncbi:unnamed protein product [Boreogadus saida]
MYTVVNDLNVSQVSRLKNTYVKTVYKEEMGFSMLICCLKKGEDCNMLRSIRQMYKYAKWKVQILLAKLTCPDLMHSCRVIMSGKATSL